MTNLFLYCIISIVNEKEIKTMFEIAIEMYKKARGTIDMWLVMNFCEENGINFYDVEEFVMWE